MTRAGAVVVLVDEAGSSLGVTDRLAAHRPPGLLHAAISVVVANRSGQVLIQRRARAKALFASLWSNSCCTHPAPGEGPLAAAERCAYRELGIRLASVREAGTFVYRAVDPDSGLVEYERDTVLVAESYDDPTANPDEVAAWTWTRLPGPDARDERRFTPWAAEVHAIGDAWWRVREPTIPTGGNR
jgi:isopentenyl-diphosphate Delta-isomerase